MTTFSIDLINAVLDALKADATLGGYVMSFTAGDQDAARKLFPFVTVAGMRYELTESDTARDTYMYTVEITVGTRSLARGEAYDGDGTDRKGILQLCEDVARVVRGSTFGGMFTRPVEGISYRTADKSDGGGTIWLGVLKFSGERLVAR